MSYSDLLIKLRPLCPDNEEARQWMDSAILQIEVLQQQLDSARKALDDSKGLTRMNEETKPIEYSISYGNEMDGKSACIWRTQGAVSEKIARFTNKSAALTMAKDFDWPLHEDTRSALNEP